MAAGKYEIKKAKNGKIFWNLKATNGEIILSSQMYASKTSAKSGIASVQKNSPDENRYDRRVNKGGKDYFVLKAANHQIIGNSEAYNTKRSMESGIKSVMKNGPTTRIDDTTAG